MTNKRLTFILSTTMVVLFLAESASAWGPEARRRIVLSAVSIIRQEVPEAFKADGINYDKDVLKGMEEGWASIAERLPIESDAQAINAISYELDTLKLAREFGTGSHFAYRMGALAALTSDAMLPYGLELSSKETKMADQIKADIEKQASQLRFTPNVRRWRFVQSTEQYYMEYRRDVEGEKNIIYDDYRRGNGFRGYMKQATSTYYHRAIEAVIDVWFTIYSQNARDSVQLPSRRTMTGYYIDEIGYLLNERDNFEFANRAYTMYEQFNPDLKETHLTIGDLFYAYGRKTESRIAVQRGVDEWTKAQTNSGKQRKMASERLSDHYITDGDALFNRARSAIGQESDYTDALNAFRLALQFNRTNPLAADRISETSRVIQQRREDYELQQAFIDSANSIMKEAERSLVNKDYATTLGSYTQALNLLTSITDQFSDLQLIAKDTSSTINKEVKRVINDIFDAANVYMDEGDNLGFSANWDQAIASYERAKTMVNIIQADESTYNGKLKVETLGILEGQILDAQAAKRSADQKAKSAAPPPITTN